MEQLSPDRIEGLANDTVSRHRGPLDEARAALSAAPPSEELRAFALRLAGAFDAAWTAFSLFTSIPTASFPERIPRVLGAMHHVASAQEGFYALREPLTPFHEYWLLPGTRPPVAETRKNDGAATGVLHVSAGEHHGGFSLYVPEAYTAERACPLIVALHGGSGNGRDFLWTWVREAKSLGYILVAPSAALDTWGSVEDIGLQEIILWIAHHYNIDRGRILLTGLSDGATFTLLYGLAHPDLYRALAPLCGVLHPANDALGNLQRARGVPIYLVHGAQDFLFPVSLARFTRDTLVEAGADLVYRELPKLSHTYPRSENVRILRWFESLPNRAET